MRRVLVGIGALIAVAGVSGCGGARATEAPASGAAQVRLEPVPGTDRDVVVLTAAAALRLGVRTEAVLPAITAAGGDTAAPADQSLVPLAAILYDRNGAAWMYTLTRPLAFARVPVTVVRVEGLGAVVQSGPAVGTQVVTVGGAELLGAEHGVASG
ncbi:MAG TPA: hypothetical protein VGL20_21425 [Candidatus Dormibacteraeota bacterium]